MIPEMKTGKYMEKFVKAYAMLFCFLVLYYNIDYCIITLQISIKLNKFSSYSKERKFIELR